jgi:hypothetical protein
MKKRIYYPNLPEGLKPPFRLREHNGPFDGEVAEPWGVLDFEPMDTLNGALELVDSRGSCLTFWTDEPKMIEDNEYHDRSKLYIKVAKSHIQSQPYSNSDNHNKFTEYAVQLKSLPDVKSKLTKQTDAETWEFRSSRPNGLDVTLEYNLSGPIAGEITLQVDGVDCSYWHTVEVPDLDYHIELATAALKGGVAYNRSAIFKHREVCFKVGDSWECTLTDKAGSYHYIKHRKKLRHPIE